MPTVGEYKEMLHRATNAGDQPAMDYFQGQIGKGLSAPTGASGQPVPQGGNILNAASGGVPFFDELAGVGGGIASSLMGLSGLQEDKGLSGNFSRGYDSIAGDLRKSRDEYSTRNPVTSIGAGILGGVGLAGPLGLLGKGVKGALGAGALYGAGEADSANLGDRLTGAGTGAAVGGLGYGALKGLSGLGGAIFPQIAPRAKTPSFNAAVSTLKKEGFPVTAAEKISSPPARTAEQLSGAWFGVGDKIQARPQDLHAKLMKLSGFAPADIAAKDLSEDAVLRASQLFTKRYNKVLKGAIVEIPDMQPRLQKIRDGFDAQLPHEQRARLNQVITSFEKEAASGRRISGPDYKRLRSRLGTQARLAAKANDPYIAPVYKALQAELDSVFRASVSTARGDALRKVDKDYGGYKILQEMARNPEAIGTSANKLRNNGASPRKEFSQLLKAYQDVYLRGGMPSSGTTERATVANWMPPIGAMIKATGAKGSAVAKGLNFPLPANTAEVTAGQALPDSDLEEMLMGLGKAFTR